MIRVFVGLALPHDVREHLAALQSGLKDARWVAAENLHLTLRFIGDVDEDVIEDICAALDNVTADPFEIALNGLGAFGHPPHSVWAGVEDTPKGALSSFQAGLENVLVRSGLEPEGRKYTPHVTLARFRKTADHSRLGTYIEAHGALRTPAFPVSGFTLFQSHLSHQGAHYTPYAEFDF